MTADQPYPIDPTLDKLIQAFKAFQHVPFPRGIPQPFDVWRPVLQLMTKHEAAVAQNANEYLCSRSAKADAIVTPEALRHALRSAPTTSLPDSEYLHALTDYLSQIENLAHLLEDCMTTLGNPCHKFRA